MHARRRYVLYLAVLPVYRENFVRALVGELGDDVALFAGPEHSVASVTTGIDPSLYEQTRNVHLLGRRLLLELGGWRVALRAGCTVVDLNPRCITAWLLLIVRRLLGRRTLAWGHVMPRGGAQSRTAALRRAMRRLAGGVITYSYAETDLLDADEPRWVAPNALYTVEQLASRPRAAARTTFLYVGRLEPDKAPERMVQAFARAGEALAGYTLTIVGTGSCAAELRTAADASGVGERVSFVGPVHEVDRLCDLYASAVAALSPGYVGLALTQAAGFGVPILVPEGEQHAPEIEIADALPDTVRFFAPSTVDALAAAMVRTISEPVTDERREEWRSYIAHTYSADQMAGAMASALRGVEARR